MNRRELLGVLGATAAGLTAITGGGARAQEAQGPEHERHPTPITDSIDSSSISCSHNNLGRRFLEV